MHHKAPEDYLNPSWPAVYAYGMDWKAHIAPPLRDKWEFLADAEKAALASAAADIASVLSAMDYED